MAKFYYGQVLSFKINYIPLQLLSDHKLVRDLSRKCRLPNLFKYLWRGLLTHDFHSIRRRNCFSIWEPFKESSDSKPMISMSMCNIDSCQVLATCCNPICQCICLLDGRKSVHQDCISHTMDQG